MYEAPSVYSLCVTPLYGDVVKPLEALQSYLYEGFMKSLGAFQSPSIWGSAWGLCEAPSILGLHEVPSDFVKTLCMGLQKVLWGFANPLCMRAMQSIPCICR